MGSLRRSDTDRWFTGVCGGLANVLSIDVKLIRIIAVISLIFAFPFTSLVYLAMTILVLQKETDKRDRLFFLYCGECSSAFNYRFTI
ncbi:PspC domain-containing protein [Geomicrobium sp. JCM 19037]|uniref:PspC domain-containing protein n=1 Tax=Geomicrobium sp. JCM 19037 TaxID=1460634 RepID=UPI0009E092C4